MHILTKLSQNSETWISWSCQKMPKLLKLNYRNILKVKYKVGEKRFSLRVFNFLTQRFEGYSVRSEDTRDTHRATTYRLYKHSLFLILMIFKKNEWPGLAECLRISRFQQISEFDQNDFRTDTDTNIVIFLNSNTNISF